VGGVGRYSNTHRPIRAVDLAERSFDASPLNGGVREASDTHRGGHSSSPSDTIRVLVIMEWPAACVVSRRV